MDESIDSLSQTLQRLNTSSRSNPTEQAVAKSASTTDRQRTQDYIPLRALKCGYFSHFDITLISHWGITFLILNQNQRLNCGGSTISK